MSKSPALPEMTYKTLVQWWNIPLLSGALTSTAALINWKWFNGGQPYVSVAEMLQSPAWRSLELRRSESRFLQNYPRYSCHWSTAIRYAPHEKPTIPIPWPQLPPDPHKSCFYKYPIHPFAIVQRNRLPQTLHYCPPLTFKRSVYLCHKCQRVVVCLSHCPLVSNF